MTPQDFVDEADRLMDNNLSFDVRKFIAETFDHFEAVIAQQNEKEFGIKNTGFVCGSCGCKKVK